MPPFRKCLAVINTRSGVREGRSVFASALQQYLDQAGILHTDILLPENDVHAALFTHLPSADSLIICGGDGTISSVVNVLAAASAEGHRGRSAALLRPEVRAMLAKPIAIVPTGLQNSIAHSLGVSSAERSVSQFVMGRADAVPVWAVRLDGRPLRYICSYLAVGTYANVVSRFHQLERVGDDYMALPSLGRHKFTAAALYSTVAKKERVSCSVAVSYASANGGEGQSKESTYPSPIRMLLAAQMPLQHGGYSLTPRATYKRGKLAATVATTEASRLRLWHLLRNEALEGHVLEEDGVTTHEGVDKLTIEFSRQAADGDAKRDEGAAAERGTLLLLDGEEVHVPHGSVITVEKMEDCTMPFLIC